MQCRHNLNYWQFGDYLGIGAGAHGKISYPDRIERTVRRRHPNDYLALMQSQPSVAVERKTVAAEDLPFEFMMNALRLTDGVPAAMLQEQHRRTRRQNHGANRNGKQKRFVGNRSDRVPPDRTGDGCF